MRWMPVQSRHWNRDKGHFQHAYLEFSSMDKAIDHAKHLDAVFRVKEVTYYYLEGDVQMAKQVLKLLNGEGLQVKGIKGISPKLVFKNSADFNKEFSKIETLNAVGVAISSKDYTAQQDVAVAQKMIWKMIENLPVVEQTPKKAPEPKTYDFNLVDPTAWNKAPAQVRIIADALKAAKMTSRVKSTDVKALLEKLVKEEQLITRQDPMKVFAYYITDKKRGFQAFGIIPPAPSAAKTSVEKDAGAAAQNKETAKAS